MIALSAVSCRVLPRFDHHLTGLDFPGFFGNCRRFCGFFLVLRIVLIALPRSCLYRTLFLCLVTSQLLLFIPPSPVRRAAYTLLPPGYLESHGGKVQKPPATVPAPGHSAKGGAFNAALNAGSSSSSDVKSIACLFGSASRWLLTDDQVFADIKSMRVSVSWLARGVVSVLLGLLGLRVAFFFAGVLGDTCFCRVVICFNA